MDREIEFQDKKHILVYQREFRFGMNMETFKGIIITKKVLVQTIGRFTAYVYNYHGDDIVSSYVLNRPFRLAW